MVSSLPSGIYDGPFSYLDNTVAWEKTNVLSSFNQLNMGPLIAVMVYIVGDFAKQETFGPQNPIGLLKEGRKSVRKRIAVLFWGAEYKTESRVKILRLVPSLIRNVWGVVDNYVEA
jgi:hypothetical protein